MSVLGTIDTVGSVSLFTETGNRRKGAFAPPVAHSSPSHHDGSSGCSVLRYNGCCTPAIPICPDTDRERASTGILTCFPFDDLD